MIGRIVSRFARTDLTPNPPSPRGKGEQVDLWGKLSSPLSPWGRGWGRGLSSPSLSPLPWPPPLPPRPSRSPGRLYL